MIDDVTHACTGRCTACGELWRRDRFDFPWMNPGEVPKGTALDDETEVDCMACIAAMTIAREDDDEP